MSRGVTVALVVVLVLALAAMLAGFGVAAYLTINDCPSLEEC